jgi:uncharacterized membrane protein YeaQ/YmgE (transglycosylase-associated protein family)
VTGKRASPGALHTCAPIGHILNTRTILLGIVGSVVGGLIAGLLTVGIRGFQPAGWIGSIIGAIIVLVIYNKVTGRKNRTRVE